MKCMQNNFKLLKYQFFLLLPYELLSLLVKSYVLLLADKTKLAPSEGYFRCLSVSS